MPSPKSEWRKAGDRILGKGPVERETLLVAMAAAVPPNYASSETMRQRIKQAKHGGHRFTSDGDIYSPGARQLARAALQNALVRGLWVTLPDGRISLGRPSHYRDY